MGGYDNKVRLSRDQRSRHCLMGLTKIHILDALSWSLVATLDLPRRIPSHVVSAIGAVCAYVPNELVRPRQVTWREPANWIEATHGRGFLSCKPERPMTRRPLIYFRRRATTRHSSYSGSEARDSQRTSQDWTRRPRMEQNRKSTVGEIR